MNEPRRLLDEGADEFERDLLRSARHDAGSDRALGRTLAAIGTGLGASLVKGTASGAAAIGLGLKWGAIGAIGGVVAMTGYAAVERGVLAPHAEPRSAASVPLVASATHPPPPPPVATRAIDEPVPPPTEARPVRMPRAEPPSRPAVEPAPPATAAPPPPPADDPATLSAEVRSLSVAQAALDRGNAPLALESLDRHEREFARGRLEPEAAVLRVRALIRSGDRASAERIGRAYLGEHPVGASAVVLRSLLGADSGP